MFVRIIPRFQASKFCTVVIFLLTMIFLFNWKLKSDDNTQFSVEEYIPVNIDAHELMVEQFYKQRQDWNISNLGAILFMKKALPKVEKEISKKYSIYIYKPKKFGIHTRLLKNGSIRNDLLEGCSVNNCIFTATDRNLYTSDAVLINSQKRQMPRVKKRNKSQRWIFLQDGSPRSISRDQKGKTLSLFYDVFNWSMSYRHDADIPIPFGRTIGLNEPKLNSNQSITSLIPNWDKKRRDVLVAIVIDECGGNYRVIKKITTYLPIDVYGTCTRFHNKTLEQRCPGKNKAHCKELSKYLFYLVIEESKCRDFISEKVFYYAYSKGAIPIIHGPSYEDCKKMLPPNSFLHTEKFPSASKLTSEILEISTNKKKLLSYHTWRNHFKVLNEHGYFGTNVSHWCRLCEAMNFNDKRDSIYHARDIRSFLDKETVCRQRIWLLH